MKKNDKNKDLDKKLENFLDTNQNEECEGAECIIKTDKSLIERINKKIITDDGKQLLI